MVYPCSVVVHSPEASASGAKSPCSLLILEEGPADRVILHDYHGEGNHDQVNDQPLTQIPTWYLHLPDTLVFTIPFSPSC